MSLKPITKHILHSLVSQKALRSLCLYERTLIKAMFLLAYHACLRTGEISVSYHSRHTLLLKDVKFSRTSPHALVRFRSYKHSSETSVLVEASTHGDYCPINSLVSYLQFRGPSADPLILNSDGVQYSEMVLPYA